MKLLRLVLAAFVMSPTQLMAQSAATIPANRTITMIVPFAAGGPGDFVARLMAESMRKSLGQQIVVENVPGAGATIGAGRLARAAGDGLTVMVNNHGFAATPALYSKLPYDIEKDFRVVGLITRSPMVIIGSRTLQAQDAGALAQTLRQQNSNIKFAHNGVGSVSHLCSLVFNTAVGGVAPTLVPYRGGPTVINDIISGNTDLYCGLWETFPPITGNLVRPFVVTGMQRLPAIPNVPTSAEAGFNDLELYAWYALFAPASTPEPIVAKLNEALRQALQDPDVLRKFEVTGSSVYPADQQTSTAAQTTFLNEVKRLVTILRSNNVVPE